MHERNEIDYLAEQLAHYFWQGFDERQEKIAAMLIAAGLLAVDEVSDRRLGYSGKGLRSVSQDYAAALFETEAQKGADDGEATSGEE